MPRFVSEPVVPVAASFDAGTMSHGEPSLPSGFGWGDRELVVRKLLRTWRGTKIDRGETYVKKHWFEFETDEGHKVVVYFDRQGKSGVPRWWLYTIED